MKRSRDTPSPLKAPISSTDSEGAAASNTVASSKRAEALSWDDYFMWSAQLASLRSKDPSTQVGACIVDADQRIVSIGYNGFPRGCSDDVLPWARTSPTSDPLETKYRA